MPEDDVHNASSPKSIIRDDANNANYQKDPMESDSTWKKYSNQKYGFEFEHPSDLLSSQRFFDFTNIESVREYYVGDNDLCQKEQENCLPGESGECQRISLTDEECFNKVVQDSMIDAENVKSGDVLFFYDGNDSLSISVEKTSYNNADEWLAAKKIANKKNVLSPDQYVSEKDILIKGINGKLVDKQGFTRSAQFLIEKDGYVYILDYYYQCNKTDDCDSKKDGEYLIFNKIVSTFKFID